MGRGSLVVGRAQKALPRDVLPGSIESRIQEDPDASVYHAMSRELAHVRRQTAQRKLGVYDKVSKLLELSVCGV